ncbi:hypothetical protein L915_05930 [Phytophthora nicotianae]|uniref:Uncharacterized protein n=1 Tax=Phytophthora nicotianae TaxID=4792 RepID=W2H4V5_PHYNI|nr:hypothetical protein L915_05930 [Phytophthora nicotianae]
MWANHVIRNLNHFTWEAAIDHPPPEDAKLKGLKYG